MSFDRGSDELLPFAVELMAAALGDGDQFVAYVQKRLTEEGLSRDDLFRVVTLLASFAGHSVTAWAEDTNRSPAQVMQAIALDAAQPDDGDNE